MPAPYSTIYEIELFCFDMVKNNPRKKLRTTYTLVDKQCLENGFGQHQRLGRPAISHFLHPYVFVLLEYVLKRPSCILFERDVVLYIRYICGGQFNVVSRLENATWDSIFLQQIHNKVDRTTAFRSRLSNLYSHKRSLACVYAANVLSKINLAVLNWSCFV